MAKIENMTNDRDFTSDIVKFSIFQELAKDTEGLRELASLMKFETFQPRDYIIDEKKSDLRMFFMLNGQVVINKMNEKGEIVVLGRSDARFHPFFGESALFGVSQRTANIVAHSQCECLSLQANDFAGFMKTHPSAVASIYKNLAKVLFDRMMKANMDIFIASLDLRK